MGSGAYQLAMSRTRVAVNGDELATKATVTVRGKEARAIDRGAGLDLTMTVATITRTRREATVTGEDGTVWVLRSGGCGCGK